MNEKWNEYSKPNVKLHNYEKYLFVVLNQSILNKIR